MIICILFFVLKYLLLKQLKYFGKNPAKSVHLKCRDFLGWSNDNVGEKAQSFDLTTASGIIENPV